MIECKKVSFSYPPNETDIGDREGHGTLRNIDLSINDGDFVLLCGTSGTMEPEKRHYPVAYADWKKDVKVSSKKKVLPIQANSG